MSTPKRKLSIEDASSVIAAEDGNTNLNVSDGALGAITTGSFNVAVGDQAGDAITEGDSNTCVGKTAGSGITTGDGNVCLGSGAGGTPDLTTGIQNTLLGFGAKVVSASDSYSVALGTNSQSTDNTLVCGNDSPAQINNVYFGSGITDTAPEDATINGTGGSGTDVAGGDLGLAAGRGTGSGISGDIVFSTSDAGASGTTLRSLTEKGRLDGGTGAWILNAPTSAPADGDLNNNQFTIWYDSTGPSLTFKHKDGGGTVRTGTIALS